jgi:putative membrane protein
VLLTEYARSHRLADSREAYEVDAGSNDPQPRGSGILMGILTMITSLAAIGETSARMHSWGPGWGPGFGFLFILIPLFWLVVFVLIFAFAGRRWRRAAVARGYGPGYGGGYGHGHSDTRSAEQTLAERFAQGDIDEVEYRARLEVLRANRPTGG